eukprot:TRINITY_DN43016_c0_g1_i1.p1 TRINITY_DN43016_c0_g1~~TRINITY_DN43016_c0_g1_i1.p1  ORF type:complete len:393 (-),score=69.30 TRINITY_DN43016_c0_g1_i1:47-1090(-)
MVANGSSPRSRSRSRSPKRKTGGLRGSSASSTCDASAVQFGMVVSLSGCLDDQTSADEGSRGGACTRSLQASLAKWPDVSWASGRSGEAPSWNDVGVSMREYLQQGGYSQVPTLSSTRRLDLNEPFTIGCDRQGASGRRRAVVIGVNYVGMPNELDGCHADTEIIVGILKDRMGFTDADIRRLADDGILKKPTAQNIVDALRWLLDGAQSGDSFFFSFSGHGIQVPEKIKGSEEDGMDEALVTADLKAIIDNDLFSLLVRPLPKLAQLTCVIDTCHSGTIIDLPHVFEFGKEGVRETDSTAMTTVNDWVTNFTGESEYKFGDVSVALLRRGAGVLTRGLELVTGLFG